MTKDGRIDLRMHTRLKLAVTAQALADCLRYELRRQLEAVSDDVEATEAYYSARAHIGQYPALEKRLKDRQSLLVWLREVEAALNQ